MHVVTCVFTIFPELRDGSNSKNAIFFSMFLNNFLADVAKIKVFFEIRYIFKLELRMSL